MILNMVGGGGAGLNFSVVGGTTQPTGKENLIWVNTDTAVTGWAFSSTQPTGAEGLVWLQTNKTSAVAFNALKKNGLWVYPTGCQQYVSGAWVVKTAKIYQSGAWVDFYAYLYNAGDEFIDFTGGITALDNGHATVAKQTTHISFDYKDSTSFAGRAFPTNKIDLTPYNALCAKYTIRSGDYAGSGISWQAIGYGNNNTQVYDGPGGYNSSVFVGNEQVSNYAAGEYTISCNLQNAVGEYYVSFNPWRTYCDLTAMWLE